MSSGESATQDYLELKVPRAWTNLITWVQEVLPFGQVSIEIVNGTPCDLIIPQTFFDVKFDKTAGVPKRGFSDMDFSDSDPNELPARSKKKKRSDVVVMKVSEPWIALIYFCKTTLPNGTVTFLTRGGQPSGFVPELSDQTINFSMDTLLPIMYMHFKDMGKNLLI